MSYFLRSLALAHQALAAFWALALRCSGVSFWAVAFPPFLPNLAKYSLISFRVVTKTTVLLPQGVRKNYLDNAQGVRIGSSH